MRTNFWRLIRDRLSGRGTALDLRQLHERTRRLGDEKWLQMLVESADKSVVRGLALPPFPDEGIQKGMVGAAGADSMRAAFPFYREVKAAYRAHGPSDLSKSTVLDFGCGWGRHLRLFLKDVPPERLRGTDVDPANIEISRSALPGLSLEVVSPLPPTGIPDSSVDLVYAYSVFSHLAEHAHQAWISEFHRILTPCGIVVVTTQRRALIDFCESLRIGHPETPWHKSLAASFVDVAATKRDYDEGRFIYSATGGGSVRAASFYGEAVVPEKYVRRTWADRFDVLDFIDDEKRDPQAIIVARKRTPHGEEQRPSA